MKLKGYIKRSCAVIFCLAAALYADQIATTPDGKQVLLRSDNTWRYATQSDIMANKLLSGEQGTNASGGGSGGATLLAGSGNANKPPVSPDGRRPTTSLLDVVRGDASFDFRKARWGFTRRQVEQSEANPALKSSADKLEYKISLLGMSCKIVYTFAGDNLIKGSYFLEQDHPDPAQYYADFTVLKDYLRQIYGTPVSDQDFWTNDIYRADRKNWGFAVSIGFLSYRVIWQGPTTKTVLTINGGNHAINTNIDYASIK
ncbi:MAG: hypothetical protein PHC61_10940 [Chitinivibrionales bacterium]|nr:hypothetical protein [Chitinivibrionales bacterium]